MFHTSHPVVDILSASSIFKALKMYNEERVHGSPYDRGEADAYYGRGYEPHKREQHFGIMIQLELETDEEKKEYEAAYMHASNRKDGRNIVQNTIYKNMGT